MSPSSLFFLSFRDAELSLTLCRFSLDSLVVQFNFDEQETSSRSFIPDLLVPVVRDALPFIQLLNEVRDPTCLSLSLRCIHLVLS